MAYGFTMAGATPHLPQGSDPASAGSTPVARALNNAQGVQASPPMPLIPPATSGSPAIKSHSIQHPDGTVVTQEFHKPEEGVLSKGNAKPTSTTSTSSKPATTQMPEIKIVNGQHHIPFKSSDGSIKFINAKGEIS